MLWSKAPDQLLNCEIVLSTAVSNVKNEDKSVSLSPEFKVALPSHQMDELWVCIFTVQIFSD